MAKINNNILKKLDYKKEYESLTPKDNLEKSNSYIKALKESIDDLKRKNIAISGIYGSGKSSIIESFKQQYKEYKYLDISLATFISSEENKLEEELERNILNQIFYKVSYDKMPYSRFRKIKNIRFLHIFKVTLIFISLILSLSLLIKPELIEKFTSNVSKLKELFSTIPILKYNVNLSLIIVICLCVITILYTTMILIKFILSKFTINKIQTKNGNVQLAKREESETFNKYLDEIMYFFESLKYDIVFFEDLDRFDNLEIFTKLRELNTLINKAESISRKVTFVYAIKDEIFFIKEDLEDEDEYKYIDKKEMNKNRTKFFDFIIPVIPIVNGENSYEILSKKIEQFNKKYGVQGSIISKELLSDLSMFIDDMRLLTNIYNEFLIYYKKLVIERKNKTLSSDNLLAIIVYKNLYPVDFTKLQNREGMVYNVFSEKNDIADRAVHKLNKEIKECRTNIYHLEKEILENEEELYLIYNNEWISNKMNFIRTPNKTYSIDKISDFNVIEELKNSNSIRWSVSNDYYTNDYKNISFENFMTINGKKLNLYNRLIAIKSKGKNIEEKIKYNQNRIQAIEEKIKEFKNNSVATLMKDERFFDCLDEKIKKEALIIRLLKYGYIDEMYSYYLLYFYEGRLTQKDFEFVQSVIYNKPLNCEFKLENINEILVKFRIEDFESKAILNYDLIKFLSENVYIDINKMRLKKIVGILSELKIEDINFIMDFIYKNGEIDSFIELLCKNINNFWNNIYENSYLPSEKKDYMLELLFKYCSIEDILIQNNEGYIKEYIELNSNFLKTIGIKIEKTKLKDILIKLNIKLKDIDQDIVDDIKNQSNKKYMSVFEDIYYNNLYDLNIAIVSKIIFIENKNIENISDVELSYSF
ncbi:YobI family P-loop NTPase, partial [Clostridium perfringens]